MRLHEHQKTVARSPARFKIFRGGRRVGKTVYKIEAMTYKSVSKLIRLAREFPNRSVIFIAPTQKQARTIVWEALKARLHGIAEFNESRLEVSLPTESGGKATIYVGGWENRENYRGMSNVIHIEFDEVDTMKDFFIGWEEIFKPMLMETGGSAGFGGTPKKENPNLRRLEKEAETKPDWDCFHFTSWDNPGFSREELTKAKEEMDAETYKQEIMAEYVDNAGSLFKYTAILDVFSNAITKTNEKYLIIDISDDGHDKTKFSFWQGLEEYRRETFAHMTTESLIAQTREFQTQDQIPMSNTLVDANYGSGVAMASSSLLEGIVGYKGSYAPIRTDISPVMLPNVHYTKDAPLVSDYKNLRSQCIFTLSDLVNRHLIASKVTSKNKEAIVEELALYQDASTGDGKRMATTKEDIVALLGHSPDDSDTWIMRMYFVVREKLIPGQSEEAKIRAEKVSRLFDKAFDTSNSAR